MWHKWVWSSVFKKTEQTERESAICITALYMKHTDCIRVTERQTFCWKNAQYIIYRLGWSHYICPKSLLMYIMYLIENYVNGALFRGRIFCRLYLNERLEFPSLCSAQCHMPKQTTRAVSDFRLQRLLSYCIMTADHSQPLQQQMQHGKLSAWIFADNR